MRSINGALAGTMLLLISVPGRALGPADVFILVNKNVRESQEVADHYCLKRGVPRDNVILLDLPAGEDISRNDYNSRLVAPLRAALKERRDKAKVLLSTYGVPLRVGPQEPKAEEKAELDKLRPQLDKLRTDIDQVQKAIATLEAEGKNKPSPERAATLSERRKERDALVARQKPLEERSRHLSYAESQACVDSELSLLWWDNYDLRRWLPNLLYFQVTETMREGKPPLLMVSRLDGPTVAIAKGLVDQAIATEAKGLSGKVYVDARGIKFNPAEGGFGYSGYDESLREMARLLEREAKLPVVLDDQPALFAPGSCPDCALYCGWYSLANYVDCCTFVPGAVAYHIASAEAVSLRNPSSKYWCKCLLEHGVAATLGPVAEPYTVGFPKPAEFFGFLVTGQFTLVECHHRTAMLTSWMTVLVGDPLYNPYAKTPKLKVDQVKPSPAGGQPLFQPTKAVPAKADLYALRQAAMNNGGDPKRGKVLFDSPKTTCATCHKVQGQGGDLGPDLSQIGGKLDRTHLIEATLDPSAEILQGYHTTIIETKSGRVLAGIVKSESATEVNLQDAQGKTIMVTQGDIESREVSKVSLMPEGLADQLTPAEFTDLVAYLTTLRTGREPTPGEGSSGTLNLPQGWQAEVEATGLTGATAMEVAPDGRIFVCEQTGSLRVIKEGQLLAKPFVTLPVEAKWERGLIGVAVAPDFPKTPRVFVCYVAAKPYPHHVISRFTASDDVAEPGSESILLEGDDQTKLGGTEPAGHQGGAIHFGKDGKLYIAIGDQTAGQPAQRLDTFQGKLLRINPDGSIPDDNPFFSKTKGKYRAIWALGLRNPFTFAVQAETGRLFINDVGGIAEEINEGMAGANYGWPTIEHGPTTDPRFRGPIHHYPTACIIGGAFAPMDVSWPKEYRGRYFFGDFNQGAIKTIDPAKPAVAKPFATGLRRPVDLRFSRDGSLYVLIRDAWVMDKLFQGGSGALLRIRFTGK